MFGWNACVFQGDQAFFSLHQFICNDGLGKQRPYGTRAIALQDGKALGVECVNDKAGRDKVGAMISRIRDVVPTGRVKK